MKIMKNRNKQKGFTLVELLIVVVILGILAAMIVPRMLQQTGQAETAEAVNMLGPVRRAAVNLSDSGGTVPAFNTTGGTFTGGWQTLGLGALPANRKFDYQTAGGALDAGGGLTATATRIGGTAGQTVTMNLSTGAITCGADYTAITSGGNTVGCR